MTREEAIKIIDCYDIGFYDLSGEKIPADKLADAFDMAIDALQTERPTGSWISEIDTGTWMLKCSVCGCRVQEEKYRTAVGQSATKCPYCGAELGLGGYSYDEYANRPSQRGEDHEAQDGE